MTADPLVRQEVADPDTPPGQAGLRWLTDHAWPLWLEHGVDWQRGAFHEHLDAASPRARPTCFPKRRDTTYLTPRRRLRWDLISCRGPRGFPTEASPGVSISTTGRST